MLHNFKAVIDQTYILKAVPETYISELTFVARCFDLLSLTSSTMNWTFFEPPYERAPG